MSVLIWAAITKELYFSFLSFFLLPPDVLFWPPVHGCQRFQPEHSLLCQTKPTSTRKIITFKVSSAQAQRRPIKSCAQSETHPPWLFCGECTLYSSSRVGPELDREFNCGICHRGAFLSPQTKLQLTVRPHLLPCVSVLVLKGEFELKCCHFDSLDVIQHTLQTGTCKWSDRDFRSAIQLSWSAGSGAATLMCQIEIRHAFLFFIGLLKHLCTDHILQRAFCVGLSYIE